METDEPMTPPPPPTPAQQATVEDDDEDRMCRYCFDGEDEGELISPCACKGGQKWVHLECLRRWQRMVLVSQPTHPMFHGDDLRQQTCNVCKQPYTCEPPTRHDLMRSFTGVEIASLVDVGCVIAAGEEFSVELEEQLTSMPPSLRHASSYEHWCRSAYVITGVQDDDGLYELELDSDIALNRLREALGDDGATVSLRGKRLRATARGSLEGVEDIGEALAALEAPASIVLVEVNADGTTAPRSCGDDHVAAVNLCRPLPEDWDNPRCRSAVSAALESVLTQHGSEWRDACSTVRLVHHVGGPCDARSIVRCFVLGSGGARGYAIVEALPDALLLSARLVKKARSQIHGVGPGARVRLANLSAATDLNGTLGVVLDTARSDRWKVALASEDGVSRIVTCRPETLVPETSSLYGHAPPEDAEDNASDFDDGGIEAAPPASHNEPLTTGVQPATGTVLCFWGDARWSRTQLLGEVARGHWGMCRAFPRDVHAAPHERRAGLEHRLVFAPVTSMTEESIVRARTQMRPLREQARLAAMGEAVEDAASPRRASDASDMAPRRASDADDPPPPPSPMASP